MPPPPYPAVRVVIRADIQASLNPDLLWLDTHVDYEPTHFVCSSPAAIVRIKEWNARRRHSNRITAGGAHRIEHLLSFRRRDTSKPPPWPPWPTPNPVEQISNAPERPRSRKRKLRSGKRGQSVPLWRRVLPHVNDFVSIILSHDQWRATPERPAQQLLRLARIGCAPPKHVPAVGHIEFHT